MIAQTLTLQTSHVFTRNRTLWLSVLIAVFLVCLFTSGMASAETFNGQFGPAKDLATNTTASFQAWWKLIAGYGLWLSLIAFAVSIIFFAGRWWWIPVAVFLLCMFGEITVNQVASWSNFDNFNSGGGASK